MVIEEIKNIKSGRRELRKFGLTMGIVLLLFGGFTWWRGKDYYFYFLCLSGAFIFLALVIPSVLKPVNKMWMALAILQIYTAEEFIAAITQHIPEKSFQMVRYYGWYSNKSRGLREKQGNLTPDDQPLDETDEAIEIIDVSEYQPRRIPSKQWRECIKKIYETDPLCCPKCGGEIHPVRYCALQMY